jgi:hypothetical protein
MPQGRLLHILPAQRAPGAPAATAGRPSAAEAGAGEDAGGAGEGEPSLLPHALPTQTPHTRATTAPSAPHAPSDALPYHLPARLACSSARADNVQTPKQSRHGPTPAPRPPSQAHTLRPNPAGDAKPGAPGPPGSSAFKAAREAARKADAGNRSAWNTLFMRADTVAEAVAAHYGLSKAALLDANAGGKGDSVAVGGALA